MSFRSGGDWGLHRMCIHIYIYMQNVRVLYSKYVIPIMESHIDNRIENGVEGVTT